MLRFSVSQPSVFLDRQNSNGRVKESENDFIMHAIWTVHLISPQREAQQAKMAVKKLWDRSQPNFIS